MLPLFALTSFVSAFLLFLVQPMVARLLLPAFGGTPAVWNTCMLFFQSALLAGYAYAHASTERIPPMWQRALHALLMAAGLLALLSQPFEVPRAPSLESPIAVLLGLLVALVGLPFLALSASAPLLQRWLSQSGHPSAANPYQLYAASNLGSMLALGSYPLVVERLWALNVQRHIWVWGFAGWMALTLAAGALSLPGRRASSRQPLATPLSAGMNEGVGQGDADGHAAPDVPGRSTAPSWAQALRWLVAGFLPSTLMLGVTTHLTTDVASLPMLWIIPLALYLGSFIVAFSPRGPALLAPLTRAVPLLLAPLPIAFYFDVTQPMYVMASYHVAIFAVLALVFHGELARRRPEARHLTRFYLWMSMGGMLGGVFNSLVAPLVFADLWEYPVALALAAILLPRAPSQEAARASGSAAAGAWLDAALLVATGVVLAAVFHEGISQHALVAVLSALIALGPWALGRWRPVAWGPAFALLLATMVYLDWKSTPWIHHSRGFFGVVFIGQARAPEPHRFLIHGQIVHGRQSLEPDNRLVGAPYYDPQSPVGQAFALIQEREPLAPAAAVGLGTGAMACLGKPGQPLTFYEIDPQVLAIATNPALFTFLADCPAKVRTVLADGRLALQDEPPQAFAIVAVDAFTSDAIPLHLITREAIELYLSRTRPDGLVLLHISNHYVRLEPVLANIAEATGSHALVQSYVPSPHASTRVLSPSRWVAMTRDAATAQALRERGPWEPALTEAGLGVWTDQYSSLVSVYTWQ